MRRNSGDLQKVIEPTVSCSASNLLKPSAKYTKSLIFYLELSFQLQIFNLFSMSRPSLLLPHTNLTFCETKTLGWTKIPPVLRNPNSPYHVQKSLYSETSHGFDIDC
jgi:hypothetical protein